MLRYLYPSLPGSDASEKQKKGYDLLHSSDISYLVLISSTISRLRKLKEKRRYLIGSLIALCTLMACQSTSQLFTEVKQNWKHIGDANWTFQGDELTGVTSEGSGYVMTSEAYDDFTLELAFMADSTINSGVFIRCNSSDINPTNCYELNIWDLHPNQKFRTGALVTKASPLAYVKTINKWNTYKIKAQGSHLQVWINDILTIDIKDDDLPSGHIALQAKGTGIVRFRDIIIRKNK